MGRSCAMRMLSEGAINTSLISVEYTLSIHRPGNTCKTLYTRPLSGSLIYTSSCDRIDTNVRIRTTGRGDVMGLLKWPFGKDKKMGVYAIVNLVDGKVYVGSSTDLKKR